MGLTDVYADWCYHVGGGDKGTVHNYLPTYERYLTRTDGVTVAEIGVWFGHSIGMWQDYFTNSTVYGLDIDLSRIWFQLPNLIQVDATDSAQVDAALPGVDFDYVIDDGSHRVADQIASFDIFIRRLKPGGVYFIEDIDGDSAVAALMAHIGGQGYSLHLYEGRGPDRQWDELMLVISKP